MHREIFTTGLKSAGLKLTIAGLFLAVSSTAASNKPASTYGIITSNSKYGHDNTTVGLFNLAWQFRR